MSGEGRSITKSCKIKVAKILGITWVDGEGNQITNIKDSKGGKVFISIQTENHHCTDKKIILRVYEYNFGRDDTEVKIDGKQFKVEIPPKDLEPNGSINGSIKVEFPYEKLPFAEYWERVLELKQWEFYCTTEWGGANAQEIEWRKRGKNNLLDMPLDRFNSYELELIEMFYGNGFKNYLKNDIFIIRGTFAVIEKANAKKAEIEKTNAKKGRPPSKPRAIPRAFSIPSIIGTPLITADSNSWDKATFIHEIFHQYQYKIPWNFAFWNLIGEQCQYSKHMKDSTKGMDPYNYNSFFDNPLDVSTKLQIKDIETYEGQAQFMGDVALAIFEKEKNSSGKDYINSAQGLKLEKLDAFIELSVLIRIFANSKLNATVNLLKRYS